jgi:Zn-dependent protease with chaperone function
MAASASCERGSAWVGLSMNSVIFLVTPRGGAMVMAALIALLPAAVSAWRDRGLLARGREDPALPERLLATQSWVMFSIAFSIALLVVGFGWHAIWAIPLLFVSRRFVAYRLRRALLGETWSFWLYLGYFARTALGLVAISLTLAFAPLIVGGAQPGAPQWIVALMLAALLAWWQVRHAHVLLWLWRATTIRLDGGETAATASASASASATATASTAAIDAEAATHAASDGATRTDATDDDATLVALAPALSAILTRATLAARPRVWRAGPPGAVVANAIALPSINDADIVISRTLIDRLTFDEVIAVFAHEVAHLEYFTRARVMRLRLNAFALIALGTLLVPVFTAASLEHVMWLAILAWCVVFIIATLARGAKVHGNELAADRRAIELCGNPEALISALTKLQAINRQPRRWSARATKHPSYAQRIRAIREAAGFRAPAIDRIEIFPSPTAGAFLLLDGAMLQHVSGVPTGTSHEPDALLAHAQHVRRMPYNALKSCRIIARWNAPAALQITEQNGRRLDAHLRDEDLPRLHDLLDIIEFGLPIEKPAPPFNDRLVAIGLLIVSMAIGQIWSLALLSLLALVAPVAEMLIGAALALCLAGLLQWLDPTTVNGAISTARLLPAWVVIALGGIAVDVVLWRLWSGRASQAKAPAWIITIVLGSAAIVWLHGLLQWDGSLLRLAQVARVTPAAMLLPLAAAVLVARARVPARRVLAMVLVIAAAVPAAMTTRWFQDEIVRDPLLSISASPLLVTTGEADMIGAVAGDRDGAGEGSGTGSELRLSPEGHAMATASTDPESERIESFTIRTADGRTRDVRASDLQFLDDSRALLLVSETDGLALRLENLGEAPSAASAAIANANATATVGSGAIVGAIRGATASAAEKGAIDRNGISKSSAQKTAQRNAQKSTTEWSLTLPNLRWSRLSLSPRTQHWRVIGHDDRNQVARLQGSIGEADYDDVRWKTDTSGMALVGSGNAMLISRMDWRASLLGRLLPEVAMATSRRSSFDVSLWRVRAGAPTLMAQSSAEVDCMEAPVDLEPAVCFAFDGIATRVWILRADDKRVTPVGVLQGYARPLTRGSDGTLVAWWRRHPVLLQLDPLRARELSSIPMSRWAHAALASNHLLIADEVSDPSMLAVYRVQTEQSELTPPAQP